METLPEEVEVDVSCAWSNKVQWYCRSKNENAVLTVIRNWSEENYE